MTRAHDRPGQPRVLSKAERELLQRAAEPGFDRWQAVIRRAGGCAHPIRLYGDTTTIDANTGEILHAYTTRDEPTGYMLVKCGNRRAERCETCSREYKHDAFHLIRAGLAGGKSVPESVREHPRLFLTLTAPSFGPVHSSAQRNGRPIPCRARRDKPSCPHGRPLHCAERHQPDDPRLGQPLCPDCYDYTGAILFNAHAGKLWHRFADKTRQRLARHARIPVRELPGHARLSFAKVAEYQARGLIHFHALVRLDGPGGPDDDPPGWATADLLTKAVTDAARAVQVTIPGKPGEDPRVLRWGMQLDIHPVDTEDPPSKDDGITEGKVAGYIAKYATKGAEAAGTVAWPIQHDHDIRHLHVTDHARRMITECWRLGGLHEYGELRLRKWAHALGYRGHFLTKSRHYSTTMTALRQARADHRAAEARQLLGLLDHQGPTISTGTWRYSGSGYTLAQSLVAEAIRPSASPPTGFG